MRVIIIGGGEIVYFLSRTFTSKGYNVSIINDSQEECENLARKLPRALIIKGEGPDPKILEDAHGREAIILLAVTPYDHVNLVCCQTGELLFKIPHALALVHDPDNYKIFKQLGIKNVFNQTEMMVSMIEKNIGYENFNHLFTYEDGNIFISEIIIKENMPSSGKNIGEIQVPQGALIIGVTRGGKFYPQLTAGEISPEDRVMVLTDPENHADTFRSICGGEA